MSPQKFVTANNMEEILKDFPPSSQNNARSIIKEKLERFKKFPSERLAQELESYGIAVDFQESDWGNGPRGDNN